ncbi:RNA-binding protein 4 [Elysia marginata]|uniref:RNA-binding protein 4 n=1 Tax=Elysia marginata TaxID=1093978 RepID=A0AAV4GR97_9GAST|nr:RNA-binding protein 4 [Elysia marginata]
MRRRRRRSRQLMVRLPLTHLEGFLYREFDGLFGTSKMVGTKLFIGNLPDTVDKTELKAMFEQCGNVVEFDILKDYGFVHYEKESEAKAAVETLDGKVHRGSNIRVEISRSRVRQKAGMGGKGECYRCGGEGHWSKECPRGPSRARSGGSRGGRGGDRFNPYDRDPYYPPPPDPYDYYARARALPLHPYDRYRMEYERRLAALAPLPRDSLYGDYSDRPSPDYYRRPSPPRDPYYDFYERRRLAALEFDPYEDKLRAASSAAEGLSSSDYSSSRSLMQSRVPGPY